MYYANEENTFFRRVTFLNWRCQALTAPSHHHSLTFYLDAGVHMSHFQIIFLDAQCQSAYCQGLEDALKSLPPRYARNPEYMQGYNSLESHTSQWAA
ncbi:hypothetical protein [Acaryochloris marina]|nr:hypothetical protein [Acaryochloris marina]